MDPSAAAVTVLPDDVLAGVLRRLPPRSLAESQCVCKAWRAVIDEQQLLLRFRHLLPHSVTGIFINFIDHYRPHLFARPTSTPPPGPRLNGKFSFVEREKPWERYRVQDHCNGLVLRSADDFSGDNMFVINPATRRWAHLPRCASDDWNRRAFIVFDPAVSPHYEVLLAPLEERGVMQPSSWTWHALSSTTKTWRERVFVREGAAAPPAGLPPPPEYRSSYDTRWRFAAYWQGSLYVHCCGEFISRLSLSDDTYTVIESPIDLAACNAGVRSFIGKSRDGVYFATIDDNKAHLRVWVLSETCSLDKRITKWLLKHQSALNTQAWWTATRIKGDPCQRTSPGPWIMDLYRDEWRNSDTHDENKQQDWDSDDDYSDTHDENKQQDWDSDDDYVLDIPKKDDEEDWNRGAGIDFLGFHPYKAVIFLDSCTTVAYHLDSGKIQYLGDTIIDVYNRGFFESFVYTPCLIGD